MIRAGIGFDAHGFDESRPLVVGGIEIPDAPGLAGHSDADVLSHAIADALLGAARLGDLGSMFPSDDAHKNISSFEILERTADAVKESGWAIANVDSTVMTERPQLSPYRDAMTAALARALRVGREAVWIKSTTTDQLGFTGRGEGMAALAVVLIEEIPETTPSGRGATE